MAGQIQEYDIKTAEDNQEALKDLLGGIIQEMMEAELDEHLGYEEYERSNNPDYRNGVKYKALRSSYGEIPIDVPRDRDGDFDPQIKEWQQRPLSAVYQIVFIDAIHFSVRDEYIVKKIAAYIICAILQLRQESRNTAIPVPKT